METCQFPIRPPQYVGGKEVIERLMQATKTTSNQALADAFDLPKSTVGTWRHRNLVPYEIVIRLHLETGISIRWLTLGEGEPYPSSNEHAHISNGNKSKNILDIEYFALTNGKLISNETLSFEKSYLEKLGALNVIAVDNDNTTYLIDKEVHQAVSGTYLVDMDGLLSLNEIQRLPGKKLAISFNGSTITVDEGDVKVVGRVAVVMEKK
ncbi:phage repressor protein CI [Vibrio fluvialis]|uniref:phage repressor protein CI n=1 Tax=Vibrio fluvialis TaxID=676 RepID=UPI001EEA7869|nr:phage repressor protein CI [Vibrio fluvialis]MCG6362193.1 helix-turn-helix domain-containing protein [Vibrio fluvialis]